MPVWFFVLLAVIVLVAVVMAITMGFRRSGAGAGGQNTTIVERRPSSDRQNTTVVERD